MKVCRSPIALRRVRAPGPCRPQRGSSHGFSLLHRLQNVHGKTISL